MTTKDPKLIGDEIAAIVADLGLSDRLHDDDFWRRRDREVAAARAADERRERDRNRAVRAGALAAHGFPELARDVAAAIDAGDGKDTPAMARAREFVAARERWAQIPGAPRAGLRTSLVLAGGQGSGKTSAATWVALVAGEAAPAFIRAGELESRGRYDRKLRDWLRGRTLLVVDDVGAEHLGVRAAPAFAALFEEVVDMFHSDRRMLVITTNLLPRAAPASSPPVVEAQFVERYGERIWSRLAESGAWANCGAEDLRRRRA